MSEVGSVQGENVLHLLVTSDGGVITFARQPPTRYDCWRDKLALIVLDLARGLAFMSSTHCRCLSVRHSKEMGSMATCCSILLIPGKDRAG